MLKPNPEYMSYFNRADDDAHYREDGSEILPLHLEFADDRTVQDALTADVPAKVIYDDHGDQHLAAAQQLVAMAKANGIANVINDIAADPRTTNEVMNPDLALPAAYLLARRIYDQQTAIPAQSTALAAQHQGSATEMEDRLEDILSTSLLRSVHHKNHNIKKNTPAAFGFGESKTESSLDYAVQEKFNEVIETHNAAYRHEDLVQIYDSDKMHAALMCEALGELCNEEVRERSTTATLPNTKVAGGRQLGKDKLALPPGRQSGRD